MTELQLLMILYHCESVFFVNRDPRTNLCGPTEINPKLYPFSDFSHDAKVQKSELLA